MKKRFNINKRKDFKILSYGIDAKLIRDEFNEQGIVGAGN